MKDQDTDILENAYQQIIQSKRSSSNDKIDRVTCQCTDCSYWADGDTCVAESIKLVKRLGSCICETYSPSGNTNL